MAGNGGPLSRIGPVEAAVVEIIHQQTAIGYGHGGTGNIRKGCCGQGAGQQARCVVRRIVLLQRCTLPVA